MEKQDKQIRKLAILILDDSNGISTEAFVLLENILKKTGSTDIVNEVIYEAGRVFLGEDTATEMISKLDDNVETEVEKEVEKEVEIANTDTIEDLQCNISPSDIMKDIRL